MRIDTPGKGLLLDYTARFKKFHLPTQLIFFVTAKCNFQCPSCFYWRNLNLQQEELSLDEIHKISASLNNLSRLLISGGEPFLRKDIAEICHIFYQQNRIQGIDLPTNGSLTAAAVSYSELILKKCGGAKLVIGLSLDGLEATHDYLRQKPGSFKSAIETMKALSQLKRHYPNLSLHIISVVSNKNIDEVVPLIRYLQQNFDIDSFGPNPIRGNPKDTTMLPPTAQQWLKLFKELSIYYKYFAAKKYKSAIQRYTAYAQRKYLDKITALVLNGKPLPFSCKAADTLAVLEPNGDIRLCELTACIGNLRTVDYDFKRIWFSAQTQAIRKQIKNCGCTHGCFLSPSIALNPYHLLRSLIAI